VVLSRKLIVPDATFVVRICSRLGATMIMCVRSSPVPRAQSITPLSGSYEPTTFAPSAVNHSFPPAYARPCGPRSAPRSIAGRADCVTRSTTAIELKRPPP